MRHQQLFALAVAAAVLVPAAVTDAGLIVAGKTNPSNVVGDPGQFQGSFNMAVFSKTGSSGDSYDTGYVGLDALTGTTGDYLYLYQVTNSGPTPAGFGGNPFAGAMYRATVTILPGASVTSTPFMTPLVFTDVDGPVSATNDLAGAMTFSQFDGFETTTDVGLAMDSGGGVLPSILTLTTASFGANFAGTLKHGEHSTVFGFLSDDAPGEASGSLVDGYSAIGTVVTPVSAPEPSAIARLLSLIPVFGFLWYRRR